MNNNNTILSQPKFNYNLNSMKFINLERVKKLRNFRHMSKMGLPYLPSTLVWTKISLDKYSPVYPTYLSKKFGHFGKKSLLLNSYHNGIYWGTMKILIIREAFRLRLFNDDFE